MVLWQWINDNLPLYAEQITINEEQKTADLENERNELTQDKKKLEKEVEQIQGTLNQFKHLVPKDFIKVETDYNFTTKSKWSKQLSERYSFEHKGEWFYIDIPHTIMESLELEKGEEITWPLHLDPEVLKRKPTCGGITIENEKEIFLEKPFTVENLKEDIGKLFKEVEDLKKENKELKDELKKEKGWWDKWFADNNDKPIYVNGRRQEIASGSRNELVQWDNKPLGQFVIAGLRSRLSPVEVELLNLSIVIRERGIIYKKEHFVDTKEKLSNSKLIMKLIYEYYKNQ